MLAYAPQLVQALGGDPQQVCAAAGLSQAVIEAEEIPVRFNQVVQFFDLAARFCATPDFGLRLSERQTLAVLGPLWPLIQNAPTVKQMLLDLKQYSSLHSRGLGGDLVGMGDGLRLSYHLVDAGQIDDRQTIELGLALLCNELRRHAPKGWQPLAVQLRYRPPASQERYRRAFGPNLAFNQDVNAITIDLALLDYPLKAARAPHHQVVSELLRQQQNQLPDDIGRSVSTVVRTLIPLGNCTLAQVTQRLALSERTLQRRLQAAGLTFAGIHDQVRADLALKYLLQSTLKSAEIADILGYADLTALSRSFRRWHGVSMREAKKQPHRESMTI
ncbi:AraC family transcriptional regulator [Chitinivorax sp. PXF-14]|uniref:AraC family transcriptional regulator n=1 Tax=Chitinivorax sp. PXF-14 TaxID=3230488 RepID=UPI003466114F